MRVSVNRWACNVMRQLINYGQPRWKGDGFFVELMAERKYFAVERLQLQERRERDELPAAAAEWRSAAWRGVTSAHPVVVTQERLLVVVVLERFLLDGQHSLQRNSTSRHSRVKLRCFELLSNALSEILAAVPSKLPSKLQIYPGIQLVPWFSN